MRINVINLIRSYAGVLERELHCARCAFTVRGRRGHVISVGGKAVSCNFTVDLRAARFGVLQFLDHHNPCAFAHHKTVAVTIEWPGGALGLIVAGAERSHG